jgi:uncharacterized phage protein (TIGR01671 family)
MIKKNKFAFWHKKRKEMWSVESINWQTKEVSNGGDVASLDDGDLLQFTGLLDKNGKKIFENDIVVLSHPCWSVKCKVKYDDQLACYVLESFEKIDKGVRKSFLHIFQEPHLTYKVIGNFYQNPELLGGQND